jgi:hypothetical protein
MPARSWCSCRDRGRRPGHDRSPDPPGARLGRARRRADYHDQAEGHWIDDHVAPPMAKYPEYRRSRQSFGLNVPGSLVAGLGAAGATWPSTILTSFLVIAGVIGVAGAAAQRGQVAGAAAGAPDMTADRRTSTRCPSGIRPAGPGWSCRPDAITSSSPRGISRWPAEPPRPRRPHHPASSGPDRPAAGSRAGPMRQDNYRTSRRFRPGHPVRCTGYGAERTVCRPGSDGQLRSAPRPAPDPPPCPRRRRPPGPAPCDIHRRAAP